MTRALTATILVGSLPLASPPIVRAAPVPGIPPDVIKNIRDRVDNGLTPSIVVGVVDANGTSYFSFGRLSQERHQKSDKNTLFDIGSITKVFTSILLADFVERRVVKLDDAIEKYLPENVRGPTRDGKKITLRDLATHRSGLPRLPSNFDPKNSGNPYADYTQDLLYDFLANYTLERSIGSKYEYSNLGGGLLGHLLARKSGKRYEQLLIDRICKPLGMDDTRITLSPEQRSRLARGHAGRQKAANWDFDCLAGCGALRSSTKDILKFLAANMGLDRANLHAAMQLSHRGRFETDVPDLHVALGWHVWTRHGTEIIWHNGGTGGYHSFCGFIPSKKLGVVVLANSTHDIDDIGLHVLEPRYELKKPRKETKVASPVLGEYVGYYELQPGVIFHVTRDGDGLFAQLTGQPRFQVFPESETKFFYKVVDAQVTFVKDDDGKVTSLILHQGGLDQTAKKVK